ncbi:MAG: hypothetical protein ACRD1T_03890 [Acidimicrobiia bacterium]
MSRTKPSTIEDLKGRVARHLSEHGVAQEAGELGQVTIFKRKAVTRTFRAHWTGFKTFYPGEVLILRADLKSGQLWTEAYVSTRQPSWVLAFRQQPHQARGSSGRPRPDDELSSPQQVENALAHRKRLIDAGIIPPEELIRMEDLDDPIEAVDAFFNYTSFYVLKALKADWHQLGFSPDPSVEWAEDETYAASHPTEAAIQEAFKKSDIIWVHPNTSTRPIPCWFVLKEGKAYVLSGERQQIVPGAERIKNARVTARWKMRDASLAEFDAAVRVITARDSEFDEIGELMVSKRQSVVGSVEENVARWKRECVILELTPRH